MKEENDSPTHPISLHTDDGGGWDVFHLVLLPLLLVDGGEQLPLPVPCPPAAEPDIDAVSPSELLSHVDVDGPIARHAVSAHAVGLVGSLGGILGAVPVRHLLLLLTAGLELLPLLPTCSAWHNPLFLLGLS